MTFVGQSDPDPPRALRLREKLLLFRSGDEGLSPAACVSGADDLSCRAEKEPGKRLQVRCV